MQRQFGTESAAAMDADDGSNSGGIAFREANRDGSTFNQFSALVPEINCARGDGSAALAPPVADTEFYDSTAGMCGPVKRGESGVAYPTPPGNERGKSDHRDPGDAGFACTRYAECGHDFLIAWSCKGRCVSPACKTRLDMVVAKRQSRRHTRCSFPASCGHQVDYCAHAPLGKAGGGTYRSFVRDCTP